MASPHIAGVVALVRNANPDLTVNEVKQIMYDHAFDLGDPAEDNTYGWGMVNAYQAVLAALTANPDLDGSGTVGFADLTILLGNWGQCPFQPPCVGDLDGNGTIGFGDLTILLAAWGT